MEIESENHCVFVSFLDQVGTKEASGSVPSSPVSLETSSNSSIGASGGEMDVPAVRPTNITDLINESYEVSATTVARPINIRQRLIAKVSWKRFSRITSIVTYGVT